MQDLFSLGLGPANQPESGTGIRASRPRHRATDTDASATNVSFDLLLAMAALPHYHEQPEQPGAGLSARLQQGDAPDGESLTAPLAGAVEHAPRFTTWSGRVDMHHGADTGETPATAPSITRAQWSARLHDLFQGIADERPEPDNGPVNSAERHVPRLLSRDGDLQPAKPERALPVAKPQGRVTTLRAEGGSQAPSDARDYRVVDSERPAIDVPNLKVVARNDRPVETAGTSQPAHLRVIHPDGSISRPRADEELLNRLANTWRTSFAGDGIQLPEVAAEQNSSRSLDHQASADGVASAADGAADGEAGQVRLLDTRGGETGQASDERRGQADTPARAADTGRPATVVPLFGSLLATETLQPEGKPEAAVGVRRALVEIASEAQRLERAGGSELSFSLKLAPEHLGEIEIDIQRVDNRWSISITTAGDAARETLAAELHRLERSLRDQNFTLDSVSVVTRGQETTLPAPAAAEQAAQPDWFGGHDQHFEGGRNWDESGRRAAGGNGTIGFDASRDGNAGTELSASPASGPLSGIDIQA